MKKLLLAGIFSLLSWPAFAACAVTNLQVKDNAAVTAAVPYADDGSGASNCSPQVQIKQGGNVLNVTAGGAAKVDGSAVTQPVSAASLPLPTGAATAANQATANSSLATIATNTGAAIPAGSNIIGKVGIDQTAPGTTNGVQVNAALPAGANTIGGTIPTSSATGGASSFHLLTAASNNATVIGTVAAHTLYQFDFQNTGTGTYDIRFYDTATAPSGGAPCNSATGLVGGNHVQQSNATSPGMSISFGPTGIAFANGIVVCVTGANADNDNTNATTGGNLNVVYK